MAEHYLLGLALIVFLGISAQWIAWKLHLPSILLLLIFGIAAGPGLNLFDPDQLFGELLTPLVSLSVAVILFEGGLSLRLADLRAIGGIVRNLVSLGILVTWVVASAAAYWILGFELPLAILAGAILVVTGPTVVIPLLRHVRPVGQIGSIVRWEGIVNDPIGAILAVLVFEVIITGQGSTNHIVGEFFATLGAGAAVGLAGAGVMMLPLRRYWIPDFLQNNVTLMAVVGAFTLSNLLKPESGLLAVTVMGIALANQKSLHVKHIIEFKENLRVFLISGLFILLAARMSIGQLLQFDARIFLFLGVLILVARPLAVWLCTLGSSLEWREKLFLCWMAPRGIVAAAVSAIFALRLVEEGYPEARQLAPLTFLVIIATVSIYGLTAFPVARWLKLADSLPQGALIVGAQHWARELAKVLKAEGFQTVLVDTNWVHISAARMAGLRTYFGGILSEHVLDDLELYGIGRLLALTPNDEANALAALHFADIFGRREIYQLVPEGGEEANRKTGLPHHLKGRALFCEECSYHELEQRLANGASFKTTRLTEKFSYEDFEKRYRKKPIPLFSITPARRLVIHTAGTPPVLRAGQTVISLVGGLKEEEETGARA